jgi:4-hydroxy-3-methylbut-2-en-1-yl diphosphate synthase IspG/GcpE
MGNTIKAIRRGIKAGVDAVQNPHANQFQAGGKTISCPHCGNNAFDLVGVAGISIAGYGIECSKCTHIQYFRKKPRQIG